MVCLFRSAASAGFYLGRYSDELRCPDDDFVYRAGPRTVFNQAGLLVVHHPCEGQIRAHIQILLPSEYREFEQTNQLISQVFEALAIPPDETYEAHYVSPESEIVLFNACFFDVTDRNGTTDRV